MLNDNLRDSQLKQLLADVRDLQTQPTLRSASASSGRTRFAGNESLLVEGSQKVSGWLIVTGTLKLVGTLLLEGLIELTGSMRVKAGGKIVVEGSSEMVIGPDAFGGASVRFPGGTLYGSGAAIGIANPALSIGVAVSATRVAVTGPFSTSADITAAGPIVGSDLTTTTTGTSTSAANTFMTTAGRLLKSTSAARFKIDPQVMDLSDALLEVPVESWIDLGAAERLAELWDAPQPFTEVQQRTWDESSFRRVPGVIAEKVDAAGGEDFVTRDSDGVIDGVAYDRLAIARTGIIWRAVKPLIARVGKLARRTSSVEKDLADALARIADLEARLAA